LNFKVFEKKNLLVERNNSQLNKKLQKNNKGVAFLVPNLPKRLKKSYRKLVAGRQDWIFTLWLLPKVVD